MKRVKNNIVYVFFKRLFNLAESWVACSSALCPISNGSPTKKRLTNCIGQPPG